MEIGSVYEIDPQSVECTDGKPVKDLKLNGVLKYNKLNTAYTASGREAIALALYSLEKEDPSVHRKCLMPAYMCDSVFIPFVQMGWELIFYHIGRDMKADKDELCSLIEKEQPGMLFLHAYYGVDTWKEFRPMLAQYQKDGLVLMEDMTQSYYLETDFVADYIVGSLRKWYAVPDGGFIATNRMLYQEPMEYNDSFVKRRLRMLCQKWKYLEVCQNRPAFDAIEKQHWVEKILPQLIKDKEEYLAANRQLEEELDHNKKITGLSIISNHLLSATNEKECEMRRNANYRILQNGLKNRSSLTLVFPVYEGTAAPLYLPVYMEDRDALQQYLRERDIYVPVLWPVGKENAPCLSADEHYIYSHIAAIPMDQRYGKNEMERIVEVVAEYESL